MNDYISVIVPIYNAEKYLEQCIDSILRQTYSAFELLLIDDGSEDLTKEICERYAAIDSRIRFFTKKNEGEAATRNFGIEHANGNIILFVDSDDYIEEVYIEFLYKALKDNNADGVVSSYDYVDAKGKKLDWRTPVFEKNAVKESKQVIKDFLLYDEIKGFSWNKMFYKKMYMDYSIRYGGFPEDIIPSLELLSRCKRIAFVNQENYHYRQLNNSSIHTLNAEKVEGFIKVLESVRCFAEKKGNSYEGNIYYYRQMLQLMYDLLKNRTVCNDQIKQLLQWNEVIGTDLVSVIRLVYRHIQGNKVKQIIKYIIVRREYR